MRITYFTESLYPHVDGVSRTLGRLFASLEKGGVEFTVFSPFDPGDWVGWRDRVTTVRFVRFPLYPDYRISLPFAARVRRLLEDDPPDLIHLVSPTPMAYWAQGHAARLGIPCVASFHTHFVSYFRHYGIGWAEGAGWALLRRFYRRCARVYSPTTSIKRELEAHGIRGVEIWSRGIDTMRFSPERRREALRRDWGVEGDWPVLLMVSRLVREKDLADLVEVERLLKARRVPHRLVMVGEGPMRGELERALPDAVFAGHLNGDTLAAYYATADVFILPSTTETLGNVVLEALASGLPAVVVDRGGPQDLVIDGVSGVIARARDPRDIATRTEVLLRDAEARERMRKAARESAISRDWEAINARLLESYAEVIGERGVRSSAGSHR